ncbi:MAG: copper amine oxidase N-terminal domain-containing protein [Defluviitaleaceae bacterium]|nr:copper amine oxidase N-terminal domain-containing protein [Defluviitaleaceae bacterium]
MMIFSIFINLALGASGQRVIRFEIGSTTFAIDGVVQEPNDYEWPVLGKDSAIYIDPSHDRSMTPTWMAARAFNAFTDFDHTHQVFLVMRDGTLMRFTPNEDKSEGLGTTRVCQETGAWFIPLRYFAESFGATVIWDDDTQAVYIFH